MGESQSTIENRRIGYLDWLRVMAMLMIIVIHSPTPSSETNGLILSSVSYIMVPGLDLFFMISGALLLSKTYQMKPFLLRRFSKIAWPTLFWSLFYLFDIWIRGSVSTDYLVRSVLSIPFSPQGNGIMWFMYTLMGLYIITPILSSWLNTASKKDVEWILTLWTISLLVPLLGNIIHVRDVNNTHMLFYLSGFIGYYILGYYLHHHVKSIRKSILLLLILFPLVLATTLKLTGANVDFYQYFWLLSIPVAMMATFWFLSAKKIFTSNVPRIITLISKYSFGIYLIHIFVMRRMVWNWDFVSQHGCALQIIMTTILTFIISFAIIYLISYLPFSKYIIGVKRT